MLALSVRVGEAVKIGESVIVRVGSKSGQVVRLVLDTAEAPIDILAAGAIQRLGAWRPAAAKAPASKRRRATWGLTGRPRRIPNR
jgi:sRNA-binding carbon storage regulator CsrA